MVPLALWASCSVSVAPGRHDATSGMSAKMRQTSAGGLRMTKLSSKRVQPLRVVVSSGPADDGRRGRRLCRMARHEGAQRRGGRLVRRLRGRRARLALRHAAHRLDDAEIAGAAAEIAGKLHADALLVGARQPLHDVARGDQHAGRAEAALQAVLAIEGFAQPRHQRIVVEALDGAHVLPVAGDRKGDAGARRLAVDQDGAGAAHAVLAAEMRAGEPAMLAQEVAEVRARLDHRGDRPAVDRERDRRHGRNTWSSARATAAVAMRRSIAIEVGRGFGERLRHGVLRGGGASAFGDAAREACEAAAARCAARRRRCARRRPADRTRQRALASANSPVLRQNL